MRPLLTVLDFADADDDGLASGNSSAGTTLTLDGVLISGGSFTSSDGLAHALVITDTGADVQTTATYTIIGTDGDGLAQSEDVAGPGASASILTIKNFLTVSSVSIANPVAGSTVDLGLNERSVSKTIPLNYRHIVAATHSVDVTGGAVYSVEQTLDEIHNLDNPSADASWFEVDGLNGLSASALSQGTNHATACRLSVSGYASNAQLNYTVMQSESI